MSPFEAKILELVNAHRASVGMPPLQHNETVARSAARHSADMAAGKLPIGHDGFGERAGELMQALGGLTAAENVAFGQNTAEEVVKNWLESPGHRQNIEGAYEITGISVAVDATGRNLFTQLFLALSVDADPLSADSENDSDLDDLAWELLELINAHRAQKNLPPMESDSTIEAVAEQHSQNMASGKIPLGYDGLREKLTTLAQQLRARSVAANIAQGKTNAEQIVARWLGSPAHLKNIEANYNRTGIGVALNEKGDSFITQLFLLG